MLRKVVDATAGVQQLLHKITKHRQESPIHVVCVADTHSQNVSIPAGDLLIHAGDLTRSGKIDEFQDAISWLNSHPHKYKVVIAGNADLALDPQIFPSAAKGVDWGDSIYLCGSSVTLEFGQLQGVPRTLVVYGNPHVPRCGADGEEAFQYEVNEDYWRDAIPSNADVVVTHTPPKYILDEWDSSPEGCPSLSREIVRIQPKLHVFGHVHPGHGQETLQWDHLGVEGFTLRQYYYAMKDRQSFGVAMIPGLLFKVLIALMISMYYAILDFWIGRSRKQTKFINAACASPDGKYMKNEPTEVYI